MACLGPIALAGLASRPVTDRRLTLEFPEGLPAGVRLGVFGGLGLAITVVGTMARRKLEVGTMEYRETHYCPNCQRGWTHTFVDHCPLNTEAWCDDCMTLAGAYGPPASVELVLYNLDHCD